VMAVVPLPTAVASPVVAPMVAICWLLVLQANAFALVRLTVWPVEVVPMAMNWAVCVGTDTD